MGAMPTLRHTCGVQMSINTFSTDQFTAKAMIFSGLGIIKFSKPSSRVYLSALTFHLQSSAINRSVSRPIAPNEPTPFSHNRDNLDVRERSRCLTMLAILVRRIILTITIQWNTPVCRCDHDIAVASSADHAIPRGQHAM